MAVCLLCVTATVSAQNLNTAYFTSDYMYRHYMNPAFGNECNYVAIPALGNINSSMQGNFGYEDIFYKNPQYGQVADAKKTTTFMNPYISTDEALGGFGKGNNRLTMSVDMMLLSAGFKSFGGYNTIELASRTNIGMSLPYELFSFAKNTGNKNYDMGDISAHAQSFIELGFGHSRDINEQLRVGAKVKLLFGVGDANIRLKDMKADLSQSDKWTVSGSAEANVSMAGFSYESKTEDYDSRDDQYEHIDKMDVDGVGLGGFGLAADFGAVYKINEDWTVSAAVNDLGFIRWTNNMQAVTASNTFEFDGFHDVSVNSDSGSTIDDKADDYSDQMADFFNLRDNDNKGGRTTGIGATLNIGATYNLPAYRKMTFGALSTTRINGIYSWTEGRLSANWEPLKWLDGGVSFALNSFTASTGWIINIHPTGFNFFIASDHILGKMSKEGIPLSGNSSIALGMNVLF